MASRKMKSPPQGIFSRSLTLFGMAAKVAASEVASRVSEKAEGSQLLARLQQAQEVVEGLGKLKGAAMKAGQLLSLEGRDFFPPEVIQILAKLQDQGQFVEFETIQKVLKKELGIEKMRLIADLTTEPVASASIGQVHRAKIKIGSQSLDVAIKVQFPGVAQSIDSDLAVLSRFAKTMMNITGKKIDTAELMKEVKSVLKHEVDYEREAKSMMRYRELLNEHPDYRVPEVFTDFSTKRVLALEWMEGRRFQDWIDSKPSLKDREKIAVSLLELFIKEFFEWGFVQTDPNLANFLIQEKPLKLVVLDFGATLSYSQEFRRDYKSVLREIHSGEFKRIIDSAVQFGLLDEREDLSVQKIYQEMMEVSFEPFRKDLQPFRFSNVDYSQRAREVVIRFSKAVKYSAPPRKILFLHRKLGGIFNILKALDVRVDLVPYWERML